MKARAIKESRQLKIISNYTGRKRTFLNISRNVSNVSPFKTALVPIRLLLIVHIFCFIDTCLLLLFLAHVVFCKSYTNDNPGLFACIYFSS